MSPILFLRYHSVNKSTILIQILLNNDYLERKRKGKINNTFILWLNSEVQKKK